MSQIACKLSSDLKARVKNMRSEAFFTFCRCVYFIFWPFKICTTFVIGLVNSPPAVRTLATLTRPSGPGYVSNTRASGHFPWYLSRDESRTMAKSPTAMLSRERDHFTRFYKEFKYSRPQHAEKRSRIAFTSRQWVAWLRSTSAAGGCG